MKVGKIEVSDELINSDEGMTAINMIGLVIGREKCTHHPHAYDFTIESEFFRDIGEQEEVPYYDVIFQRQDGVDSIHSIEERV